MVRSLFVAFLVGSAFSLSAQVHQFQRYDLEGEVIQLSESSATIIGHHRFLERYEFEDRSTTKQVFFRPDGKPERELQTLDGSRHLTELTYAYEDGRELGGTFKDQFFNVEVEFHNEYDGQGRLLRNVELLRGDTVIIKNYSWRGTELHLEELEYRQSDRAAYEQYTWEDGRRSIWREWDERRQLLRHTRFYYNEQGDLRLSHVQDNLGHFVDTTSYTYTYDDRGNWTSCMVYQAALGTYTLRIRELQYRGEAEMARPEGRWRTANEKIFVNIQSDGTVGILDAEDEAQVKATLKRTADGYELEPGDVFPIIPSTKWNNKDAFSVELQHGSIRLQRDERESILLFPLLEEETSALEWAVYGQLFWEIDSRPGRWDRDANQNYGPEHARVAAQFDEFKMIAPEYAWARLDDKYALVHAPTGVMLTEARYDYIKLLAPGLFRVSLGDLYGLVNEQGREILPPIYERVRMSQGGQIGVALDRKAGYFDRDGNELTPIAYETVRSEAYNRLIVEADGRYQMLDYTGREITPRGKYRNIRAYGPNRYMVVGPAGWGMTDSLDNGYVLSPAYERIEEGPFGFYKVWSSNDRRVIMSDDGEQIGPRVDDLIFISRDGESSLDRFDFIRARAIAVYRIDEEWGYVNGMGHLVKPVEKPERIRQFIFAELDQPGYRLYYPKQWTQSAGSIQSNEVAGANVSFELDDTNAGMGAGMSMGDSYDPNIVRINGLEIQRQVLISGEGRSAVWTEKLIYPLTDGSQLRLTFRCRLSDLLLVAQDFYDIAHSVEIK